MGLICPAWDRRWSKYSVPQISCGFIFGPLTKIPNAKHCKRVWKIISLHIFAHEFAAWFRLFQIHPGSWFEIVWSNKKPWKVEKGSSYHLHMCTAFAEGSLRQACLRTPIRKVWLRRISGSKNMAIVYPQVFSGSVVEFGEIGVVELVVWARSSRCARQHFGSPPDIRRASPCFVGQLFNTTCGTRRLLMGSLGRAATDCARSSCFGVSCTVLQKHFRIVFPWGRERVRAVMYIDILFFQTRRIWSFHARASRTTQNGAADINSLNPYPWFIPIYFQAHRHSHYTVWRSCAAILLARHHILVRNSNFSDSLIRAWHQSATFCDLVNLFE